MMTLGNWINVQIPALINLKFDKKIQSHSPIYISDTQDNAKKQFVNF